MLLFNNANSDLICSKYRRSHSANIRDIEPISRFISETIQDRAIVTVKRQ